MYLVCLMRHYIVWGDVICANFSDCFFKNHEIYTIVHGKPAESFEPHVRGSIYLALEKMI